MNCSLDPQMATLCPARGFDASLGWVAILPEETVANRTSIGILSVSVRRSSLIMVHFTDQDSLHEKLPNNLRFGLNFITTT
jgi:hypothetical protein